MAIKVEPVAAAAYGALKSRVDRINALNVYPVPDGDTGTNMLLTLRSVLDEVSGKEYESGARAAKEVSRAALMGARGNSGVILSQIIRGACDVLGEASELDAATFAAALERARERAYSAIRQPVEGTMLTVIRDAAEAAGSAAGDGADLATVVEAAAREAHASVERTPELLDVLREAGVVDAGGLGVAVLLDGLHAYLTGEEAELRPAEGGAAEPEALPGHEEEAWGYCTEFIVTGFSGDPDAFRDRIHEIGKSVLVVADDDLVKVHLHTQDPGEAISYAGRFGRLSGVKVDDMEAQTRERAAALERRELGVVATSRGAGSRRLFEGMGAVVVEGGQGANPSASDLAEAVRRTRAKEVVLLPNNKNIIPTANQVEKLVDLRVHVIDTKSIAAGLATMVGFDAEGDPEMVVEEMREIAQTVRTAEVTRSVREARVNGRSVPEGAYIGLLDGELEVVSESLELSAIELAERLIQDGADILTLLRGEDLAPEAARRIAERIRELDPGVEVELKDGDQPLYPLQMVAE